MAASSTKQTTSMRTTTTTTTKMLPALIGMRQLVWLLWWSMLCIASVTITTAEHVCELEVSEGVPIGYQIGYIGEFLHGVDSGPPYLIVPVQGSAVEPDLSIDHTTGEIRTKVLLDRETRATYSFVAIPMSGENIKVLIRVLDENDNAPTFPSPSMNIEFPENTPRDVKRTLNPARDADLGRYNTQRYNIVSGNVNNAFRLSSHRERDGVLYLDLQINGFLDRETTPFYSLVIEAIDGGNPPLRGQMTVNISIQDVNDNTPIFNQSRYFASVPENATIGTKVLQVYATDIDAGNNGLIEPFSINRRQSDREQMFQIDSKTGIISVNKPLDFETKELHELVVVARDHGEQPLETTAFVSISVTNVNDNQPIINVIFLSDDATPKISESAQPGEFVARISVNDPDSKTEYSNVSVKLIGGDGHFGLTTRDSIIYLVIVSLPLDREVQPNYTLSIVATDQGNPPLHASKTIYLKINDENDNAPEFEKEIYHANVMEVADPGTSVLQVAAIDRDEGNNSVITYSILDTPNTHSEWFQIDQHTGLITTRTHIDCETEPVPQLIVQARDNGVPSMTSTATVFIQIHDVNDNEPIFDQSFYNATVSENDPKGKCILKVSASDPDCGVNAMVNYTLGDGFKKMMEFEVKHTTGDICISGTLDYETRSSYEFPIIATDQGGLSTTAIVKIQVTDFNDNAPIFYPLEYNVSLREASVGLRETAVVSVVASDLDSDRFGTVSYRIVSGNEAGIFRIDRISGEIFVSKPTMLSSRTQPNHKLNISASDGGGLRSSQDAVVYINVIDSMHRPPVFEKTRYTYSVKEDIARGTVVGSVLATSSDSGSRSVTKYSIYGGDPDGYFSIDSSSGNIRIANKLDHETKSQVLLNVQAASGDPPDYAHTQVMIHIEDVNDNAPEFESSTVRISIPENAELGTPLYAANAHDKDSEKSGTVRYRLTNVDDMHTTNSISLSSPQSTVDRKSNSNLFSIDAESGHLTLLHHLDYETAQRHALIVTASDLGEPSLTANLTILVEVQDVNDNSPMFERNEYTISVSESTQLNSQILQVTATDLDTGNNARLTYRIMNGSRIFQSKNDEKARTKSSSGKGNMQVAANITDIFGIFPNNGWIYLRGELDRETCDYYDLTIVVNDNGTPSASATTHVIVNVLDANDNDPMFVRDSYEFTVEENTNRNTVVGVVSATDIDLDMNAELKYHLIPDNSSFHVNPNTGEIITREALDREQHASYDFVIEARDQGTPSRSSRAQVRINVTDKNDNSPEIVDPQEDVVSVREEQPPGTYVVRIRAIDRDNGYNASVTYSILKGRDSDGYGLFSIDSSTGIIRTRVTLDHEERSIYRLAIAANDGGKPSKQTVRLLRVEVLNLNDNRPTFTSSSLIYKVREDAPIGYIVGFIGGGDRSDSDNTIAANRELQVTYTLNSISTDVIENAFDIDRSTGSLVVARQLDREQQSEYRIEVRALDTTASNNPQSSAVNIKIEIIDQNDNYPQWPMDPIEISIMENSPIGMALYNFTATDLDLGPNGNIQYELVQQMPWNRKTFNVDPLTGTLTQLLPIDYEDLNEYLLVVKATDQSVNLSERLSSLVTARITVIDANDNGPVFVYPNADNAMIYVSESLNLGDIVTRVIATDKDSNNNSRISYSIISGNEEGQFGINSVTGSIKLMKPFLANTSNDVLSTGNSRKHNLVISATDNGSPVPLSTQINAQIIVQGLTTNPPKFSESIYYANISENVPFGTFVVRVNAKSYHSDSGRSLLFEIPAGVGDDLFTVDSNRGIVTTRGNIDREARDSYVIPIYVTEAPSSDFTPSFTYSKSIKNTMTLFDVATLVIKIFDVNDHAPEFRPGTCYPLAVPENHEAAIIHTVVATDLDDDMNGDIIYTITGGNFGNKFSIDMHTGELTARPLDREMQARYLLQITAQDRGSPITYQSTCNISIAVEDQNDSNPRFELTKYTVTIAEDVAIGTPILTVKATDADIGKNAQIVYSLANETDWLFNVDNRSGVITTTDLLDREKIREYNFMIVATDGGLYDAREQSVPVQIVIEDVNDNAPVFDKYPFKNQISTFVQPGQKLIQVSATDIDEGPNGEVVYSLTSDTPNDKFRLNPSTGILTATKSLSEDNGRVIHLKVIARDKGNPPQSTIGLIELRVGDVSNDIPSLRFQNEIYTVSLMENVPTGHSVVQLNAVRSDGRRQKIIYSIESGNDDDAFEIDAKTGEIKVQNSASLDYEERNKHEMHLIVVAHTDSSPILFGYCTVVVHLQDENDNAPRFTQRQYEASVLEGNNKGTFVMQVKAFDIDQEANSRVLYHIVDGNPDNAFVIEPASSGIVKTNIVLDREIRDTYRLKVIATDEGVPQMTGTSTIHVHIIDVNDNQPTFPRNNVINVAEGTELGTVLMIASANDVDTYPSLAYSFDEVHTDEDALALFSIDRFSGKVLLKRPLDYEMRQEYQLKIVASDSKYKAQSTFTIHITDENDNAPEFTQLMYQTTISGKSSSGIIEVLKVNATDMDSEKNAHQRYSLVKPVSGFYISETTGLITANASQISKLPTNDVQFSVMSTDSGTPTLKSTAAVRIKVIPHNLAKPNFIQNQYRKIIIENADLGTVLLKLSNADQTELDSNQNSVYRIISGNDNDTFDIVQPQNALVLVKHLDREATQSYSLRLALNDAELPNQMDDNATIINVFVAIEDVNDNAPVFQTENYEVVISETVPLKYSIAKIVATDADMENTPNSEIVYDITSGNDDGLFSIDLISGVLLVNKKLDYDSGHTNYSLVIRACDSGVIALCNICQFNITLTDENDNEPHFAVSEYLEYVAENEPIAVSVFTARAVDLDRGKYGKLNYSIESASAIGQSDDDEAWKLFKIDPVTGIVTTNAIFDYEQKNRYTFAVKATDTGGRSAYVKVRVMIDSRDEYSPQFTERTYKFGLATPELDTLPVGYIVYCCVLATDRDKGPDGRVVYQLTTQHPYFKINRTTGAIMIKRKLNNAAATLEAGRDMSLVVSASSGRPGSLTNMTVVEIALDALPNMGTNQASTINSGAANDSGIADWALGLLISLILVCISFGAVFLFLHFKNRRHKQVIKPNLSSETVVGNSNSYVDPSAFDTIPIRANASVNSSGAFAPPKYDEIPPCSHSSRSNNATTSELSGSEQSGSSGRGSAEDDGEDEEIRMINEGPLQRDNGMHMENGRQSDVSVQNTQEYLARLGIVDNLTAGASTSSRVGSTKDAIHHTLPIDSLHMFDEDSHHNDITNLIYAKLNDVTVGSDRASCVDEAATTAGSIDAAVDHMMSGYSNHPVVAGNPGPSMNGSLSSIVHSEEELTGSYNWDYLLDWGPQYQPLAHVFSEIARLKDDTLSLHSGNSGASTKSKAPQHPKHIPPPLLTHIAPRSVLTTRGNSSHTGSVNQYLLPRSPISHESITGFSTSSAMSPSFSPSLSPLATQSPSISPHVSAPNLPSTHRKIC